MNVLIISATVREINPFLDHYRGAVPKKGISPAVDLMITGTGLLASTYSLSRQLFLKPPALVIQAGIAGCFDRNIPLGAVLAVKQDRPGDQGVVESNQWRTLIDLGLTGRNQPPYRNGWLVNHGMVLKKVALKKVNAITVNEITSTPRRAKLYKEKFGPVLESMEGAALHFTCLMEKIPFIQLRAVSNYVGERDKKKWRMKEAITNLNNELIRLLKKL